MKTIREGVAWLFAIIAAGYSFSSFAQSTNVIEIGDFTLDLATATPLATNDIPETATFYYLLNYEETDGQPAPVPFDLYFPWAPVYLLGTNDSSGVFLLDDTWPNPNLTNGPTITWPVYLTNLTLVPSQDVPEFGTFYLYQDEIDTNNDPPAAYPYDPYPQCDVYSLGITNVFLVDDTGAIRLQAQGGSSYTPPTYPSNALYLSISNVSGYVASLVLHNTQPDTNYDILFKQSLSDPEWLYAGTITGTTGQTNTPFVVPVGALSRMFFRARVSEPEPGLVLEIPPGGLTSSQLTVTLWNTTPGAPYDLMTNGSLSDGWNVAQSMLGSVSNSTTTTLPLTGQTSFFVKARSTGDGDRNGIPDWWELLYFGYAGIDPYAQDSSGDGWTLLQDYQKGFVPGTFHTPPTPQGLAVRYNTASSAANVSWIPSPGPVTGYTVEKLYSDIGYPDQTTDFSFLASANSFGDTITNTPSHLQISAFGPKLYVSYKILAHYAGGDSAWSDPVPLQMDAGNATLPVQLISGPQGSGYLVANALPPGTTGFEVTRVDWYAEQTYGDSSFDQSWAIPVSALTNGFFQLPDSIITAPIDPYGVASYYWWVQAINGTNDPSAPAYFGRGAFYGNYARSVPPYFDGRTQLKQNLIFLLRSARMDYPFAFTEIQDGGLFPVGNVANCAYAGFYFVYDPFDFPDADLEALQPFGYNNLYRNFAFNVTNLDDNGFLTTGVGGDDYGGLTLQLPPTYELQQPTTTTGTIAAVLATNDTRWLWSTPYYYGWSEIGVGIDNTTYSLTNTAVNLFGLPFVSAKMAFGKDGGGVQQLSTLNSGSSVDVNTSPYLYAETAQPQFQLVGYNFWQPRVDFLPGHNGFSTANTNHLLIASMGARFDLVGYAKLAVQNGFSGAFGYLGQYFDKAYAINTNGVVTTNLAGMLSPYGMFFPTNPGPAALVTMADPDTGARGTGVVNVVKLQLDVNHDGIMDLSFAGPDNTSQSRPFVFWVNDDNDWSYFTGDQGVDKESATNYSDYSYQNIPSQRDLEDYARLWICGVPALPPSQGYSVTISMSAIDGNPAINLVRAVETNGGTSYLTDTNIAAAQIAGSTSSAPSYKFAQVNPSQSYTFPSTYFTNAGNKYFLFEGADIGEGQLTMTISQGSTVLAQTSTLLDLHDIKDLYEAAVLTNDMSGAISNWTSHIEAVSNPQLPEAGGDQDLIVLIHGINVGHWDWINDSETVYKRLYWASYQGKFATVKWPCEFFRAKTALSLDTSVFNRSEVKAYKAGSALATYLTELHAGFPGYRLHLLAHSQGNAITGEAIEQGAPFDTYILTEGAIPASAYDVNAPTNQYLLADESLPEGRTPEWQPMGYHGVYTNLTGRIVNFYNPKDPVLDVWGGDQAAGKPDGITRNQLIPSVFYDYDGTNGWRHNWIISQYLVTDPQESRAYISRSRTLPIGQTGPASGHGVIQSAVDMNAQFKFADSFPGDHSAQWVWPIQTCWGYYDEVLSACLIPTIQR